MPTYENQSYQENLPAIAFKMRCNKAMFWMGHTPSLGPPLPPTPPTTMPTQENQPLHENRLEIAFKKRYHMPFYIFPVFSVFRIFRPIRKRKSKFLGTVGILRSSPILRYPVDVYRCPGWATMGQNGKTGFVALAQYGSGIPDFQWHQRDPQVKLDP